MARRGSVGGKVQKGGEETTWTRARGKCGAGKRYGKARMCSPKKAFSVTWGPLVRGLDKGLHRGLDRA